MWARLENPLEGRIESSPPQKLQLTSRGLKISSVTRGEESRYDLPLILPSCLKGVAVCFQMVVPPRAAKIVSDNSVSEGLWKTPGTQ